MSSIAVGSVAVGAYLETLRQRRNIPLRLVLDGARIAEAAWYRIRKGEIRPKAEVLSRLVVAVEGRIEDVDALLHLSEEASDTLYLRQIGRDRAYSWLDVEQRERVAALRDVAGADQLEKAIARIRARYPAKPDLATRLVDFLDSIGL